MMWWTANGWGWAWGIAMMAAMLVFWSAIVWAVVAFVRSIGKPELRAPRTPETILAERFAAGEVDEHEYRSRLETLRGRPVVGGR